MRSRTSIWFMEIINKLYQTLIILERTIDHTKG